MSKGLFVESLKDFYKHVVGNQEGIDDMTYIEDEYENEWVYVSFGRYSQKRFSVNGDNNQGILKDFVNFLNHKDRFEWLDREECIND